MITVAKVVELECVEEVQNMDVVPVYNNKSYC